LAKTLEVFLGEFERRFGELHVHEQRGNVEGETAFIVGHQRDCLRGNILCRLQAVLPLLAALNQVAKTQVCLGRVAEILAVLRGWREQRQIFPVGEEIRIGTEVGRGFLGLALLNRGARRQYVVVVLERQLNGFVERDSDRTLGLRNLSLRNLSLRFRRGREQETGEQDSGQSVPASFS
jgi:hypothetical protein